MNITYKYREDEIIIENKYRYNKKMLDKTGKKHILPDINEDK